jgi:hypothetical protein
MADEDVSRIILADAEFLSIVWSPVDSLLVRLNGMQAIGYGKTNRNTEMGGEVKEKTQVWGYGQCRKCVWQQCEANYGRGTVMAESKDWIWKTAVVAKFCEANFARKSRGAFNN